MRLFNFALLLVLSISLVHGQEFDLLLKGGHVIDPKNDLNSILDVAIKNGKVHSVADEIAGNRSSKVIDVSGMYVTPGLIDMHAHVFHGTDVDSYIANAPGSLAPDGFTFRSGVTTVVDAGSSGWRTFRKFKHQTIDQAETRVLAFISIVGSGMYGRLEAQNLTDMDATLTAFMIDNYPDDIIGVKAHHYRGSDFTPEERAVAAGNIAKVPVMVDFGEHDPMRSIKKLFLETLRPGDIFTHTYSYTRNRETVVDENGKVKPFIFDAQDRGIIFDVGHGGGSFIWHQVMPSIDQGFLPDVISTDLHYWSMNDGLKDMSNLLSKFLCLGMTLEEVIDRATWTPAQIIQRDKLGHLTPGTEADIAVFSLSEGNFGYLDSRGRRLNGNKKLTAELTLRAGQVKWDLNGISVPSWDTNPLKY